MTTNGMGTTMDNSRISAAENLSILFDESEWLLYSGDTIAVKATDIGLDYTSSFGTQRLLPARGILEKSSILQIVLGYQHRDETWRLGFIVAPEIAEERGSRWCELAHWPDPDRFVFKDQAQQTGRALADVLGVPFKLIESQPAAAATPPPPLPELPLSFGMWTLNREQTAAGERLVFQRDARWQRSRLMRGGWYWFWAVIYALLSYATLTSDLALPAAGTLLPNPQLLPYLGLIIAAGLVLMGIYQFYKALTVYNRVVIDPVNHTVEGIRGNQVQWEVAAGDVQSVYVSEVVKKKKDDPASEHGEINLHLGTGQFQFVLEQGEPVDNSGAKLTVRGSDRKDDAVMPLTRYEVGTPLQAAATYLAEAIGALPVWYDMRVK